MCVCDAFAGVCGPPTPLTVSVCRGRCDRKCRGVIVFALSLPLWAESLDVSRLSDVMK